MKLLVQCLVGWCFVCGPVMATAPEEAVHVFCVDNYGAISVDPQPRDANVQLREAPPGMELLAPGDVLLWAPKESQLGKHSVQVAVGPSAEVSFRIEVKPLERALCVFAHEDDEFGIAAKMGRMVKRGVDVWGIWTCGGNPTRNREATRAMTHLGLKEDRLIFQTIGDFRTPSGLDAKIAQIAGLLEEHAFDQIYTLAYEGGHVQHDMAHFIAVQAAKRTAFRGQIYEFGLYNLAGGKPNLFSIVPAVMPSIEVDMSQDELDAIVELVPFYPSQKHVTQGFLVGLSAEQKKRPRHRPRPNWDYTRPPHKGLLWFEMAFHRGSAAHGEQIAGPVRAFYREFRTPVQGTWEQDRSPAEKGLSGKVYGDPFNVR